MVSIIVPAYQSASYISFCIQSVLRQTWKDLELILVDDGSTDQTREICRGFMKSDSRIRLLSQKHKGVSAARNAGIQEAKGEYLFFLDSDDAIHPKLLETLCGLAERTGAEIVGCNYDYVESADFQKYLKSVGDNAVSESCIYMDNKETLQCFFGGGGAGRLLSIGGKLIRKDAAGTVRFDESLSNGEDTKYIYQLIVGGAGACTLPAAWYYYRRREENASRIRTLSVYKSIYRAEGYIRDREWKSGREANAVKEEYVLVRRLLDWYMESRKERDKDRTDCLKEWAESERSLELWGRLSLAAWVEFWLAFCCPVLYNPFYCLLKAVYKFRGLL